MTKPLRKAHLRAVDPSRNRKATPEEVRQALAEADELLAGIAPLDMLPAADLIRTMQPSPEALAILAFRAARLALGARGRVSAKAARPSTLIEQVRRAGVQRYAEARDKAPELYAKYSRKQLTDAISKAKRRRNSP